MKFIDFISLSLALSHIAAALPAAETKELEPITGTIISTGVTENGEPYTITSDHRDLTDADIKLFEEMAGHGNGTDLDLAKRSGGGSSGNCNQWYSNKYCYCSGEMSNRGDSYWGSQDMCNQIYFKNFRRSEFYHVKWLPTVKIEYWAINTCDVDRYVGSNCGDIYLDLIDWCQWTWDGAKGGHYNFDTCLQFRFDVNSR